MTGTLFQSPDAIVSSTGAGRNSPLALGEAEKSALAARSSAADLPRRQATWSAGSAQPAFAANAAPAVSASASVRVAQGSPLLSAPRRSNAPLWMIARWKSPLAVGDARCRHTE